MTRIPAGKIEYHSLPAFYLNTIHFTDFQSYKTIHHLPIPNWIFNSDYKSLFIFHWRLQNSCKREQNTTCSDYAEKLCKREHEQINLFIAECSRKWKCFNAKSRICSDYGEAQPKMDEVKPAAKRLTTN